MWNGYVYTKPTSLKELQDLSFCDLMMLRMRKVFKENKISWSDKAFAKSCNSVWWVENYKIVGTKERKAEPIKRGIFKDLPPRTYMQGIYSSKNRLKEFLKCETKFCPSDGNLRQLAEKLGYMTDDEIIRLEGLKSQFPASTNKDFKPKKMYDLLSHLKPNGSRIGLLESAGYFRKEPDGSYSPLAKALRSPRVEMWERYKQDQNIMYKKLKQEADKNKKEEDSSKDKNRFKNLKRFFNIKNYEDKYEKGEKNI